MPSQPYSIGYPSVSGWTRTLITACAVVVVAVPLELLLLAPPLAGLPSLLLTGNHHLRAPVVSPAVAQEPPNSPAAKPVAAAPEPAAPEPAAPAGHALLAALEQSLVETIAAADKSVVAIARQRRGRAVGRATSDNDDPNGRLLGERTPDDPDFVPHEYGTGVIIDRDGLIITNYHVIGEPQLNRVWVWVQRKPYLAEVKAADPWLDLAVLKINAQGLSPIKMGNGQAVRRGQIVVALGNPHAIARDGQPSASWGIIANLSRKAPRATREAAGEREGGEPGVGGADEVPAAGGLGRVVGGRRVAGETLHQYGTLIQTDCRLHLGYSGGALLNLRGEMIGLTTSLAPLEGEDSAAGFAIPVDELFQRALEALKAGRKVDYGFLGLAPESLLLAQRQEGRSGVRVAQIVPGTPAARSDLKLDDIVKEVAGVTVAEPADMIRELSKLPADAQVVLSVERTRGKQTVTLPITVQLAKKYIEGPPGPYGQATDPPWRGLSLDHVTATAQFASRVSTNQEALAIAIVSVETDSPAWKAGLRPGDWISHVADQRVGSPADFYRLVARLTGPVTLRKIDGPEDQRAKVVAER